METTTQRCPFRSLHIQDWPWSINAMTNYHLLVEKTHVFPEQVTHRPDMPSDESHILTVLNRILASAPSVLGNLPRRWVQLSYDAWHHALSLSWWQQTRQGPMPFDAGHFRPQLIADMLAAIETPS